MKNLLSIIIVDYNSSEYLKGCLRSLQQHRPSVDFEIIIVDNASPEDHGDDYRAFDLPVQVLRSERNLGFGGANNFGVSHCAGEYVLLLNPDTQLLDDSIAITLDFLQNHPVIGIVCPRLYTGNNEPEEGDYYGDFPTLKTVIMRNNHRAIIDHERYLEVERGTGAYMLMRKELYEKVGGFDTNFFMYFEDIDLCKRIRNLGKKIAILNGAKIIHYGGRSQPHKQKKAAYYRSQDYFFKKHYGTVSLLALRAIRFPYAWFKTR